MREKKWRPAEYTQSPKIPLIAFGAGSWKQIKGTLPGLKGVLLRGLKTAELQGNGQWIIYQQGKALVTVF